MKRLFRAVASVFALALASCGKATTDVDTVPEGPARVVVQPTTIELPRGAAQQLEAVAFDQAGRILTSGVVLWQSSDTVVASVSNEGLVRARAAGTATITASRGGVAGTALVRVRIPPTADLLVVAVPGVRAWTTDSVIAADSGTSISYTFAPNRANDSLLVRLDGRPVASSGTVLMSGRQTLVAELVSVPPSGPQVAAAAAWLRSLDVDSAQFAERLRVVIDSISASLRRDSTTPRIMHEAGRRVFGDSAPSAQELGRLRARSGTFVPLLRRPAASLRQQASDDPTRAPHVLFINGVFNNEADLGTSLAQLKNVLATTNLNVSAIPNLTWTSDPDYPVAACIIRVSMLIFFKASPISLLGTALDCTSLRDLLVARQQLLNVTSGFPIESRTLSRHVATRLRSMIDAGEMPIVIGHSQGSLITAEALQVLVSNVQPAFRLSTVRCVMPFGLGAPTGPLPRNGERWRGVVSSGDLAFDIILWLAQNGYERLASTATAAADEQVAAWRWVPIVNLLVALAHNTALHSISHGYLFPVESADWLRRAVVEAAGDLQRECRDILLTEVTRVQLRVGEQSSVRANRFTPVGTLVPGARYRWSIADPSVATIDPTTGAISGRAVGQSTVTIESGDATTTIIVEVLPALPTAPQAPSQLTIVQATTSAVELRWQDNATNELSFSIERAEGSSGAWQAVGSTMPNATSYVDSQVQPGRTYRYRVRALNAAGASSYSNEVEVTLTTLPRLVVDRSLLSFAVQSGGPAPAEQAVRITNGGGGVLDGLRVDRITYTAGAASWLTARLAAQTAPTSVSVAINQSTLSTGVYEATLTLVASPPADAPVAISVRLTVAPPVLALPSALPEPLFHPNLVATSSGVMLLGGVRNQPGPSTCANRTDRWEPSGGGSWMSRATPPSQAGVVFAAVASDDADVYLVGGQRCFMLARAFHRYSTALDTWSRLPDLPSWSLEASSVMVGNRLYVSYLASSDSIGAGPNTRVLDAFNLATGAWERLGPVPGGERAGVPLVLLGGRLYVVGGDQPSVGPQSRVDIYDIASGTWSSGPPLPVVRSLHQAAAVSGKLYVMGGIVPTGPTFGPTARVDVFDPATGQWTVGPSLPTPRQQGRAFVLGTRVCVAGGSDGPSSILSITSSILCLDTAQPSQGWQQP